MSDLRALAVWLYREKAEQRWSDIADAGADEIERLEKSRHEYRATISSLEAELDRFRDVLDAKNDEIERLQSKLARCDSALREIEALRHDP